MRELQLGQRVEMTDANGSIIKGRVTRTFTGAVWAVFQRGWTWPDGTKEPRSDFAWFFPPNRTLNDEPSMVLRASNPVEREGVK
jgi:hypothetical protein